VRCDIAHYMALQYIVYDCQRGVMAQEAVSDSSMRLKDEAKHLEPYKNNVMVM